MTKVELSKKIDNYWYYYKLHTFVAIFILIAIIITISTRDTSKHYGLALTVISPNIIMSDKLDNFQKQINANATFMNMGNNVDPTTQMANTTKFMAMMQVGELDVIIGDKTTFSNYGKQGAFMKLDELIKKGRLPKGAVIEKSSDNGSEYIMGIDIKHSKLLKDQGFDVTNMIIGIAATSKNVDTSLNLINQLLK